MVHVSSAMQTFSRSIPFSSETLDEVTHTAYSEIFEEIQKLGLRPLRFWNFVTDINNRADELGNGDAERYKLFNKGRRKAWLEYDQTLQTVCAATCVGSQGPDILQVRCLATEYPVVHLENPRQISFLDYSAKYGTPPCSRRGTLHLHTQGTEVWVSGTASIVGEENKFAGDNEQKDIVRQTQITLENINLVISDENLTYHWHAWQSRNLSVKDLVNVKVYLRNLSDKEVVQPLLMAAGMSAANLEFIHADICRRALDIEIEGMIPA
jgi:hypothetical protein